LFTTFFPLRAAAAERRGVRLLLLICMAASEHLVGLLGVDSANSIPEAADVRLAFHAGWRSSSLTVGFGEFLAAHVASRYVCCALRPAIAGTRTLVCELPELAETTS